MSTVDLAFTPVAHDGLDSLDFDGIFMSIFDSLDFDGREI